MRKDRGLKISAPLRENKVNINRSYEMSPSVLYLNLISEYAERHYGDGNIYLRSPSVIVVHATEVSTLRGSLNVFEQQLLRGRGDILSGGELNVGIHFLVDRDGTIYSFVPTTFIVRHTIGLNHVAIGIENIGFSNDLTDLQLEANIRLIKWLMSEFKTIKHVIGHYEYNDETAKHYHLLKQQDPSYRLPKRYDPSPQFMAALRGGMSNNFYPLNQ